MLGKAAGAGVRAGTKLAIRGAQQAARNAARQGINAGRRQAAKAARMGAKNYLQAGGRNMARAAARSKPGRALSRGYQQLQRAGARTKPLIENAVQLSQIAAGLAPYFAEYGGERGRRAARVLDDQTKYKVGDREMSRAELMYELSKANAAMEKMNTA